MSTIKAAEKAKSWKLEVEERVGILTLDEPGTDVNVLTTENLTELSDILSEIKTCEGIHALMITSAKDRIFIAGADIKEIEGITTEKDAFDKAEQGKAVFQKLQDLEIPTMTVINGACLGGGYELALSTDLRVAAHSDKVKIGLPEVNLGILPGFGGSIRLPRLLGLVGAMPLLLAGKMMAADKALKAGMVDRLFYEESLLDEAKRFARQAMEAGADRYRHRRKKTAMTWFLEETAWGKGIVFKKARKDVLKKTKGVYPAPLQILDLLEKTYGVEGLQPFKSESEDFAKLGATNISKNLIKLFFMNERYKKLRWTDSEQKPLKVKKCGVIGAGVMGGGIAQRVSYRDIPVRVKDLNEQALGGALKEAYSIYSGALKRRRLRKHDMEFKMGLISVGLNNDGLKECDMIIEAVVEDLGIKQKVFKELGEVAAEDAVLASNTSSLPVTEMAKGVKNPERVAGLHFFNPVHLMPLVEIIRAEKSSDKTIESLVAFSRLLGKTVIVVKDSPGFLVNRLLLPYMNEAAYLLEAGMSAEKIDKIATRFGMPMGPILLTDQVGIDVGYKVAKILENAFGDRMKVSSILEDAKSRGLLGKKSGKGFYLHEGKSVTVNPELVREPQGKSIPDDEALKRMIYIMVNEAARCLDEGVVTEPAAVDMGMVMGTGFPPFRAGLLHYADSEGLPKIVETLEKYSETISAERFKPADFLKRLADSGKGFYSS